MVGERADGIGWEVRIEDIGKGDRARDSVMGAGGTGK